MTIMGCKVLQYHGLSHVKSLPDLLSEQCAGELPEVISCISAAPFNGQGILLGMAAGFISLHTAIAGCPDLIRQSRS